MADPKPAHVFEAETAKYNAEAQQALANARLLTAQALEKEAEAECAAYEATRARHIDRAWHLSDEHHHVFRFSEAVSDKSVSACMSTLARWHRDDPNCDIELIFYSPGGSVIAGMALFDEIKRLSLRGGGTHKVTTGVAGYAASMAGILLQAGDVRWMGAESFLLVHEISGGTGGKIGDLSDTVDFYKSICERVVGIFVERSGGKCTKAKFVKSWQRTDWWLLSDEALRLGFVDEVR
jgi:ATP-dependent protease ClpP protease subunit